MVNVTGQLPLLLGRGLGLPPVARWALTVGLFLAALLIRLGLGPLHGASPGLTFYPAILLSAALVGWREATAVLILSVVVGSYLFIPAGMYLLPVAWAIVGGLNIAIVAGLRHLTHELQEANERQRVLFHELQHRVANTLQGVLGTFEVARSRMNSAPDEAARLLEGATARIKAAAEVHRRLNDPALFESGLGNIVQDAVAAIIDGSAVDLHFEIEPLRLTFDQMSMITMLVIEAANNAQKHAFKNGPCFNFGVSLKSIGPEKAALIVQDDGAGHTPVESGSPRNGLGLQILEDLVNQLGGSLAIAFEQGTKIAIEFPLLRQ